MPGKVNLISDKLNTRYSFFKVGIFKPRVLSRALARNSSTLKQCNFPASNPVIDAILLSEQKTLTFAANFLLQL